MLQTALIDFHRSQNARLVDFAGWEMPVVYTSIIDEHHWTRRHASLFDVSHMGRVRFDGAGAEALLERLCTRPIGTMKPGQSRYGHVCREDGGILDDVIVSRYDDHFLMVCNASNREKLLRWFERQRVGFDCRVEDQTFETGMIAIQGPEAIPTLERVFKLQLSDLKRYHFKLVSQFGVSASVFRSGYTGEDGVEIIAPAGAMRMGVPLLLAECAAAGAPIKPAGLGARDTLRLEAGMPLYGHELTEEWDSITAGQGWCVELAKSFIGQPVLQRVKQEGPRRTIAGFVLDGKRIARQGAAIFADGREVGVITSGSQSPTLDKVIAMGLIETAVAQPGKLVEIDLRGSRIPATVTSLPFYKRGK